MERSPECQQNIRFPAQIVGLVPDCGLSLPGKADLAIWVKVRGAYFTVDFAVAGHRGFARLICRTT